MGREASSLSLSSRDTSHHVVLEVVLAGCEVVDPGMGSVIVGFSSFQGLVQGLLVVALTCFRSLTFGTVCSGSEMAGAAMRIKSELTGLKVVQRFSCELSQRKREFAEQVVDIKNDGHPCCSFSDVTDLAQRKSWCSRHYLCPTPRANLLVAGLSCKDLSMQNPRRPGQTGSPVLDPALMGASTSSRAFFGFMSYVDQACPDILLIENSNQLLENQDGDAQVF